MDIDKKAVESGAMAVDTDDAGSRENAKRLGQRHELPGDVPGERYVSLARYAEQNRLAYNTVLRWVRAGSLRSVMKGKRHFVVVLDPEFHAVRDLRAEKARLVRDRDLVLSELEDAKVALDEARKGFNDYQERIAGARDRLDQLGDAIGKLEIEQEDWKSANDKLHQDYTAQRQQSEKLAASTDAELLELLKERLKTKPELLNQVLGRTPKGLEPEPITPERVAEISREVLKAPGLRELGDWVKEPRRLATGYAKFLETDDMDKVEKELVKVGKIAGDQLALVCQLFVKWREEKVPSYVLDMRREQREQEPEPGKVPGKS